MKRRTNRRQFLQQSALAGVGFWVGTARAADPAPGDRIRIGIIGAGGYGYKNLLELASMRAVSIVALCDVDEKRADRAFGEYKARHERDFRRLLDSKDVDAVVISTPDHTHAVASIWAMQAGKDVYCETPLAHNVWEARLMAETAAKHKRITQMGNQSTAFEGLRRAVALVQGGALGPVREVHLWTDRPNWQQATDKPRELNSPPDFLRWDLWLGPAPERRYSPDIQYGWRGWSDFGTGALGDVGCHLANLPFQALRLGPPASVTPLDFDPPPRPGFPKSAVLRFDFPARGRDPAVELMWYDGRNRPPEKLLAAFQPKAAQQPWQPPRNGALLVGDKGLLYAPGESCTTYQLVPEEAIRGEEGACDVPSPAPPSHHQEWVEGIRARRPPRSDFRTAAVLTEALLLGNVALRVGGRIDWDARAMRVVNKDEANRFLRREYRKGWQP